MADISIDSRIIRNKGFIVTDNTELKIIVMNGFTRKQVTVETGNTTVKVRQLKAQKRLLNEYINIDSNTRMFLENVFNKYVYRFAVVDNKLPWSAGSHRIKIINGIPVWKVWHTSYRRSPPTEIKAVEEHINNLITEGVIEESQVCILAQLC